MQSKAVWCTSLFFILLCTVSKTHAYQNLSHIREAAQHLVQEEVEMTLESSDVEVTVGHVDSRIRLDACESPLEASISHGNINRSRLTVLVTCPHTTWQVRVPVQLKHYQDIVVANRTLQRGDRIQSSDLTLKRMNVSRLNHHYTNIDDVLQHEARRLIREGDIVKGNMIQLPKIIKRGEQVKIHLSLPGLDIETSGQALSDAVKGETVQVRNLKSQRIVEATVIGPSLVRVIP